MTTENLHILITCYHNHALSLLFCNAVVQATIFSAQRLHNLNKQN